MPIETNIKQPAVRSDYLTTFPHVERGAGRLLGLGILVALVALAVIVAQGRAVPPVQEIAWLRHLAEQGDAGAQLQLGLAYRDGRYDLTPDAAAAQHWLALAASNGKTVSGATTPPRAGGELDRLAARLDSPTITTLAGTWDLLAQSAALSQITPTLEHNAQAGDPLAEFQLGMRYRDGAWNVQRDPARSHYWLHHAAVDGNPLAAQALAEEQVSDYASPFTPRI